MAQTKSVKPIRSGEYPTINTEFGPVQYAEYTYRNITLRQKEIDYSQQQAILKLLVDAGVSGITSFSDIATFKLDDFINAVIEKNAMPEFLKIVLAREDGVALETEWLTRVPGRMFADLMERVLTDFFSLNPYLWQLTLRVFALVSGTRQALPMIQRSVSDSVAETLQNSR